MALEAVMVRRRTLPLSAATLLFVRSADRVLPGRFLLEEEDDGEGPAEAVEELGRLRDAFLAVVAEKGPQFLKLNGSAPLDAKCFVPELRFIVFEDVLLALKNSARIGEAPRGRPNQLELSTWVSIDPAAEFRVHVGGGGVCAVRQRHMSCHFPGLREHFDRKLRGVIEDQLRDALPELPDGAELDVYLYRQGTRLRVLDVHTELSDSSAVEGFLCVEAPDETIDPEAVIDFPTDLVEHIRLGTLPRAFESLKL